MAMGAKLSMMNVKYRQNFTDNFIINEVTISEW